MFIVIYFVFFIIPLYCMHVRMPYVLIKEPTYLLTIHVITQGLTGSRDPRLIDYIQFGVAFPILRRYSLVQFETLTSSARSYSRRRSPACLITYVGSAEVNVFSRRTERGFLASSVCTIQRLHLPTEPCSCRPAPAHVVSGL